jgi:hypothetical protein|tara:strand:- start:25 stop:150 length:126 start_codon:yes stop_codon:yes gene_type:complete
MPTVMRVREIHREIANLAKTSTPATEKRPSQEILITVKPLQ